MASSKMQDCRQKCASAPVCALTVSSKMQDLSPKVRKCSSLCTYGEQVENVKIFKNEKCAHRRCTDWSMCEKKCDTWAKALPYSLNFALSIATMLILISYILCVGKIGSRSACIMMMATTIQGFRHQGGSRTWISHPPIFF